MVIKPINRVHHSALDTADISPIEAKRYLISYQSDITLAATDWTALRDELYKSILGCRSDAHRIRRTVCRLMMNLRRSASYFHPGKTPDANRVGQPFDEKMLESMGLVTSDGFLTQAGILFSDNCNAYNSKLVGTRWAGLTKTDAINDHEYQGNLLLLLRAGVDFVNSNTNSGWMKLPDGRKNLPDYAERATLEAIVNRDYTVIGGEVHIDIFDDRIGFNSPGGMFDGTLIQNRDISKVPSVRRNPILADVFTHLEYMEKRGSGLRRICDLSAQLDDYKAELHPEFMSETNVFYTTIKNVNYPSKDEIRGVNRGSSKRPYFPKWSSLELLNGYIPTHPIIRNRNIGRDDNGKRWNTQ